jgi:cytochrome c biogenesis protein CcmG, thiol:disulfide interchange protein DsbE
MVLLVGTGVGAARADGGDLAGLLTPLDLRPYRDGTRPPDLKGHTLDRRPLSLADLRGRVVLVNFWATWCFECRPEMPVLESLHRELAPRGLAVIGVNAREPRPAVERFARELALTFPLVFDESGAMNREYGVVGLPTTFVLARDGRAVAFAIGAREWGGKPARALIDTLLAEPVPAPATR